MGRRARKPSETAGLAPGTLVHVGEQRAERVKITVIEYDAAHFSEREVQTLDECFPLKDKPTITWINVDGIHDVSVIEALGRHLAVHPLFLEDILNTSQRPKLEEVSDYAYIVVKSLEYDRAAGEVVADQTSLLLGPNFVISLQEEEGDLLDPVRERLRSAKGRLREMGADYLAYALMDAIVDGYFAILEALGDRIDDLEEQLVSDPKQETLHAIHLLRRQMLALRKAVWPLREVIAGLQREPSCLITEPTIFHLRDVYDHAVEAIDTIETFRDLLSGMLDIYLSSISNRLNAVMKVLTGVATIFMPLTFLAGVYGMNFKHMPELEQRWAYPALWAVMLGIGLSMWIYFKRKDWL
jgi:magnesium transporter